MKKFILATIVALISVGGTSQTFSFTLDADSIGYGSSASTIMIFGELKNTTGSDIILDIIRVQNDLPVGWQSTICTDVCYPPTQDTSLLEIEVGDSSYFDFSFYTASIDTGFATVFIKDQAASSYSFLQQFMGIANTTGIFEFTVLPTRVEVFPNPSSSYLTLKMDEHVEKVEIFNLNGILMQTEYTTSFSVQNLAEGVYLINVKTDKELFQTRFIRIN
ncbi:MAG: T9SS type A sorting domain-containing protein [Flavobacteriales bacterium]|nr:T9SS type A sorting domain-containing protein [Flavobacteriales bacterium]